jgi:hypothetical protein
MAILRSYGIKNAKTQTTFNGGENKNQTEFWFVAMLLKKKIILKSLNK